MTKREQLENTTKMRFLRAAALILVTATYAGFLGLIVFAAAHTYFRCP